MSALTWHVETVDSAGYTQDNSLALDNSGNPHICYSEITPNSYLKYAVWNGSAWQIQIVDYFGGYDPSLALDSAGNPHISYYCAQGSDLKYAVWTSSKWQLSKIDVSGDVGWDTSLKLDSSGNPRISYYDYTNGDLKYAAYDGSSWRIQTVDWVGDVGLYSSLALDSSGSPRISYYDHTNGDLKYAAYFDSSWWTQTVDWIGVVGYSPSLVLDSSENPHISYYDPTNYDLKYAVWTGSTWQISVVDPDGGWEPSLVLDKSGNPQISYNDATYGGLRYALYNGSAWHIEIVDSETNAGRLSSLALDGAGYPRISYCEWLNADIRYARGVNPVPEPGPGSLTGILYVASSPRGATISIDGTERGTTNRFVNDVPAGIRNVTLTKEGYYPMTVIVDVPAERLKVPAPITLTKFEPPPESTGTLYVASSPRGATISIDGTERGTTNQFVNDVPAGIRNVTLTREGYYPMTVIVDVPVGGMKILAPITLSPSQSVGDCPPPCTSSYDGSCACPEEG